MDFEQIFCSPHIWSRGMRALRSRSNTFWPSSIASIRSKINELWFAQQSNDLVASLLAAIAGFDPATSPDGIGHPAQQSHAWRLLADKLCLGAKRSAKRRVYTVCFLAVRCETGQSACGPQRDAPCSSQRMLIATATFNIGPEHGLSERFIG